VEVGGDTEIAAFGPAEAEEREFDAILVVETKLVGLDFAGLGPALKRLG
jgi:hypothetical protein